MNDFIYEESFRDGVGLPSDALEHERTADQLVHRIRQLPPGSVIAVQGSWGRGKTDLLARVASRTWREEPPRGLANRALWVNPWQYGEPDLVTPLVLSLIDRSVGQPKVDREKLYDAAVSLLTASAGYAAHFSGAPSFLTKAVTTAATDSGAALKSWIFGTTKGRPELDAVAAMGRRFRQLVNLAVSPEELEAGARLVICVDDMDRCLPDRQVALLRAIRFLTSTGAPVSFLVALDPTLAREAVVIHFGTRSFDAERYLDKMFHLRLNLPAVGPGDLGRLVRQHMGREVPQEVGFTPLREVLTRGFGPGVVEALTNSAGEALSVPDLRNPRVLQRLFLKLEILADSEGARALGALHERDAELLLFWMGLAERWPDVRRVIQDADEGFVERFTQVSSWFVDGAEAAEKVARGGLPAAVRRLPGKESAPELSQVFAWARRRNSAATVCQQVDGVMESLGI